MNDAPCKDIYNLINDAPCKEIYIHKNDAPCTEIYIYIHEAPCAEIYSHTSDVPCTEIYIHMNDVPCEEIEDRWKKMIKIPWVFFWCFLIFQNQIFYYTFPKQQITELWICEDSKTISIDQAMWLKAIYIVLVAMEWSRPPSHINIFYIHSLNTHSSFIHSKIKKEQFS